VKRNKKRAKRSPVVSAIEAAITIAVAGFTCWLWTRQAIAQRGRKRIQHTRPAVETPEPEPTTVDELMHTVSTAGPVTMTAGSEMLN
jgi:hypothetical protein